MAELTVHKRRVGARIHLANRKVLTGQLYADLYTSDGRSANVIDRLNEAGEKFLPVAMESEHQILLKSRIVSVELHDPVIAIPQGDGIGEFHVYAELTTGEGYDGKLYAYLPPARSRVLDFLNCLSHKFVPIWTSQHVVALNVDCIVSVRELLTDTDPHLAARSAD